MIAKVRKLDDTRPVTAVCDRPDNALVYDEFDVSGINYGLQHPEKVHEKFPDTAILSSETVLPVPQETGITKIIRNRAIDTIGRESPMEL